MPASLPATRTRLTCPNIREDGNSTILAGVTSVQDVLRVTLGEQGAASVDVPGWSHPAVRLMAAIEFAARFTRELATPIGAGPPIEEALNAVARESEKQHLLARVMGVRSRVLEGRSPASSLADFPASFNVLYCSSLAAAEQSGELDTMLEEVALYL